MRQKFNIRPRYVDINLEEGYYFLDEDSATGKTYLSTLLKEINELGLANILVVTYSRLMNISDIIKHMTNTKYDLIMFDRFDLYCNEDLCETIEKISENTVILIDIKDLSSLYKIFPRCATINIKMEGVEIV